MSIYKPLQVFIEGRPFPPDGLPIPPIEDPSWDEPAAAIGEALLHERAQLPPVVLGQCEEHEPFMPQIRRCRSTGILCALRFPTEDRFLCPKHGATLDRAVRRWPR